MSNTVNDPAAEREPVHFDPDDGTGLTACFLSLAFRRTTTNAAVADCPDCAKGEQPAPLVHYNPGTIDIQTTPCGLPLGELVWSAISTNPAAVDCPACAASLIDVQLVDVAAVREPEPLVEHVQALAPPLGPPVARTISVEMLDDELRALANAAITAEFRKYDREPELLPPESRAAVVVRAGGQLESVTDVETDVPQRNSAEALAWLLHQAQGRAWNLDAELLMPTPDVLAALAGQTVGHFTASVPSSWGVVQPGWYAGVETLVDDQHGHEWLLVEDRRDCDRPGECVVAAGAPKDCNVVTLRGRGVQHLKTWYPVHVRIPAESEVGR